MATSPERPKSADPKSASAHDFSLDPLPVPEATESNTDTAWGLWEHTLKAHEEPTQAGELKDFPETEQAGLMPPVMPPVRKKI